MSPLTRRDAWSTPRIAHLVLAAVVLAGCGSTPTQSSSTATLRAVVHIIPTGPPISGVAVTVQGKATVTADGGTFTIVGLSTGPTTVTLTKEGFVRGDLQVTLVAGDNFFSLGMAAQ